MRINKYILILALIFSITFQSLEAKEKEKPPEEKSFMTNKCTEIKEDIKRLKCFDDWILESKKSFKNMESLLKSLEAISSIPTKPNIDPELENKKSELIQAYIPKIRLYELQAFNQPKSSYDKTIVPAVNFKLQNNGDKNLSMVEVTLYFKDTNGNVIYEESYHPISVRSWDSPSEALKPGYIWQLERGNVYIASKVPTEWREGFITGKITDVEFQD